MGIKDLINKITSPDDIDNSYVDDPYANDPDDIDDIMGVSKDGYDEPATYNQPETNYTPARSHGMNISGSAIELKVVKPESYKNASQIADHLLSSRTVVLNLENTNKETARRLIDFLTGAAYAIGGDIKKVSNNTYVITPGDSVAVSGDQLKPEVNAADDNAETADDSSEYYEL